MKTWTAVDVQVGPEAADAAASALGLCGALGTEIDGLRKKPGEPLTVTGFFDEGPDLDEVREAVVNELSIYGISPVEILDISTRLIEETDWLAEWKRHWRPTHIGQFVIAPPWADVPDIDKILIHIEPNMAFGTGTHETTQLCLDALGRYFEPSMSVLDVGTGTGILAIAAAKLGGDGILACDTDEDSVKIARENAVLNGVSDRIDFVEGPIDDETAEFDMVVANLTLDVIVPMLPLLVRKSCRVLVLSGILASQEGDIRRELAAVGAGRFEVERSGEWLAVVVRLLQEGGRAADA